MGQLRCSTLLTPVGFEPTPLRNGALSHRLRLHGQSVHEHCLSHRQRQSMTFTQWVVSAAVENTCGDRARARARRHCEARPGTTRPNQPKEMQVVSISARGGGHYASVVITLGPRGTDAHLHSTVGEHLSNGPATVQHAIDACGLRAHALTEWRLEPPP